LIGPALIRINAGRLTGLYRSVIHFRPEGPPMTDPLALALRSGAFPGPASRRRIVRG